MCVQTSTSPGIDTRQKGPTAFSDSSERHKQSGMNEVAKALKQQQLDSTPSPRLTVQCFNHRATAPL